MSTTTIKTNLTGDASGLIAAAQAAANSMGTLAERKVASAARAKEAYMSELAAIKLQAGGYEKLADSVRAASVVREEAYKLAVKANIPISEALSLANAQAAAVAKLTTNIKQQAQAQAVASSVGSPRSIGLPALAGGGLAPLTPSMLSAMDRHTAQTRELSRQQGNLTGSTKNSALGFLAFSQALEDSQYGIKGVLNNIPQMILGFGGGAGLAGAISIAAVAAVTAYAVFEKFSGLKAIKEWAATSKEMVDDFTASINKAARETADLKSEIATLARLTDQEVKTDFAVERRVDVDADKYKELADAAAAIQRKRATEDAAQSAATASKQTVDGIRKKIQALHDLKNAGPPDFRKPVREAGQEAFDAAKLKYTTATTRATDDLATAEKNLIAVSKDWERTRSEGGGIRTDLEARRREAAAVAEEARRTAAGREAEKSAADAYLKGKTKAGEAAHTASNAAPTYADTEAYKAGAKRVKDLEDQIAAQKRLQAEKNKEVEALDAAITKTKDATAVALKALSDKRAALKEEIGLNHEQRRTREESLAAELKSINDIAAEKLRLLPMEQEEENRKKEKAGAPARQDLATELDMLKLQQQGRSKIAEELGKEVELRKEAKALAETTNRSEEEMLATLREINAQKKDLAAARRSPAEARADRAKERAEGKDRRVRDARAKNRLGRPQIPRTNEEKRKAKEREGGQAVRDEQDKRNKKADLPKADDEARKGWGKLISTQEKLAVFLEELSKI